MLCARLAPSSLITVASPSAPLPLCCLLTPLLAHKRRAAANDGERSLKQLLWDI